VLISIVGDDLTDGGVPGGLVERDLLTRAANIPDGGERYAAGAGPVDSTGT